MGLHLKPRHVDISMPKYIPSMKTCFQLRTPTKRQDAPHPWTKPIYGAKVQYSNPPDESPLLPAKGITDVQQKLGTAQYYAQSVDPFLLCALGYIGTKQAKAKVNTAKNTQWLMDYCVRNPVAVIWYYQSDMVLYIHSDSLYLSVKNARSQAAGHYFLYKT